MTEKTNEWLAKSLGEPDNSIEDHSYEIRPQTVEGKREWWMFHNGVGSGEPLAQWLSKFATLHAQKIADKMKEANQFILDIAQMLGIETDGVGFDGITLSIDDFSEAADKMVEERLREELIKYTEWLNNTIWGIDELSANSRLWDEYLKSKVR